MLLRSLALIFSCLALSLLTVAVGEVVLEMKVFSVPFAQTAGMLCAFLSIMFMLFAIYEKLENK